MICILSKTKLCCMFIPLSYLPFIATNNEINKFENQPDGGLQVFTKLSSNQNCPKIWFNMTIVSSLSFCFP